MANRTHHSVDASRSDVKIVYSKATLGAGAAEMTGHSGDLVSSTRTGAGVHTLVFRHSYPEGMLPEVQVLCGTTVGLMGQLSAWDPVAKTATLQLTDAGVAADGGVADIVYFALHVRNSGAN
jgi:hypothetical protein